MSNIQPYIILNGTDSRTISGLLISALAPISKPLQRTLVDTVDGRDGDLVTPLGFSAYDKTISIALTYGYDIDDIIEYFNSEGVVTFSNEPDKYYRYAIYEQIDFEKLIRFKTAEVTLHCQPFKFSTTETPKLFNVTSGSPITIKNDGNTQSRPNLTIIGSGDVDLSLNGSQVLSLDLEDNQAIIIDTEDMNAYAAQTAIKEVIAEINPVQDLHGQEYPYPAGGGKNIVPLTISNIKNANTSGTWVNNVYTHNEMAFSIEIDEAGNVIGIKANGTASGGSSILRLGNFELSENTYDLNGLSHAGSQSTFRLILTNSSYSTSYSIVTLVGDSLYTASEGTYGLQIVISDGIQMSNEMFYPMIRLSSISDSTFAPYENICPITGFTESNVTLFGVNIWGGNAFLQSFIDANIGGFTYDDDTMTYTAPAISNKVIQGGKFKENTQYTFFVSGLNSIANTNTNLRIYYTDGSYNTIQWDNALANTKQVKAYVTAANKTVSYLRGVNAAGPVTLYYNECGCIEGVLTVDDFVPYLGSEYTIEFEDDQGDPITAYKGHINFTTGVLTLDYQIVDLSSLSWITTTAKRANTYSLQGLIKAPASAVSLCGAISDKYHEVTATTNLSIIGQFAVGSAGNLIFYRDTDTPTGNLVYPLATPIEIQLTPTIINNLLGLNQMYADNNGDISVTFSSNGVIQTETGDIVSFNVAVEDMQKGILLNRLVIGDYDKIRLSKGDNTIVLSGGAQQFVIDKYSRWL